MIRRRRRNALVSGNFTTPTGTVQIVRWDHVIGD